MTAFDYGLTISIAKRLQIKVMNMKKVYIAPQSEIVSFRTAKDIMQNSKGFLDIYPGASTGSPTGGIQ